MINYYGSFVAEMRQIRGPLDELLKKDKSFTWTPQCQDSFDRVKKILSSDLLLTHFNPAYPIVVAADASNYGIGAVISHRFPDGTEKAIFHAGRSLTPAQKNYSQIEKEALGLIFAVQKFHRYIYGRHFSLLTDHRPLLAIFGGSKSGVPVYTASRLMRWATILLGYDFTIEYRRTTELGQADALSRLINSHVQRTEPEDAVIGSIDTDILGQFRNNVAVLPNSLTDIREATKKDKTLELAIHRTKTGWPEKVDKNDPTWNYFNRRDSLSVLEDCLLTGERTIIPKVLQPRTLSTLHIGHPGITRMKQLARSYVYWPGIDKQIEAFEIVLVVPWRLKTP